MFSLSREHKRLKGQQEDQVPSSHPSSTELTLAIFYKASSPLAGDSVHGHFKLRARKQDPSILPGHTVQLTLHQGQVPVWSRSGRL